MVVYIFIGIKIESLVCGFRLWRWSWQNEITYKVCIYPWRLCYLLEGYSVEHSSIWRLCGWRIRLIKSVKTWKFLQFIVIFIVLSSLLRIKYFIRQNTLMWAITLFVKWSLMAILKWARLIQNRIPLIWWNNHFPFLSLSTAWT